MNRPMSVETIAIVKGMLKETGGKVRETQRRLEAKGIKVSTGSISKILNGKENGDKIKREEIEKDFGEIKGKITTKSLDIRTVDQALKIAKVDLRVWEIERTKINSWEVTIGALGSGTNKPETFTNYQVCVWLRRKTGLDPQAILDKTIEQMKVHSPVYPTYPPPVLRMSGRTMLEVAIFDVHYGERSWMPETGVNYDSFLAETIWWKVLEELLDRTSWVKPELIYFPVGNDFLHVDTAENITTGGTRQDVDTRFTRTFERGKSLLIKSIDRLMEIAPVIVPVVPGNHDREAMMHLGSVLAAWYRKTDRVAVNFAPTLRKYVKYGVNLIGYTHGKEERLQALPLIMANERAKWWSETKYRCWHIGHLHKELEYIHRAGQLVDGVYVKMIPSLAPIDAWHYRKGYLGTPVNGEAFLWDFDKGPVGEFRSIV